ncbi:hypothetical protein GCM10009801_28050 [Streptomyces albiaxialis]|uniref:Secreted protein n=1 Tax=Streptomyces albiaxialis TaxID=329523 RepID=A0ABP5HEQ8_9ACTN
MFYPTVSPKVEPVIVTLAFSCVVLGFACPVSDGVRAYTAVRVKSGRHGVPRVNGEASDDGGEAP